MVIIVFTTLNLRYSQICKNNSQKVVYIFVYFIYFLYLCSKFENYE